MKKLFFIIALTFTVPAYCDITNDVTIIKTEVANLRKLLKDKYTTIYLWDSGPAAIYGTQNAIVTTLFNVAKGLKESILPAIQNLGAATNQLEDVNNNLQNILTYTQNIDSHISEIHNLLEYLRSDLTIIDEHLQDIRSELYNANDHLASIVGFIAEISSDFNDFIYTFDQYKTAVTDYLRSIELNVSTIASNQESYLHYISDIYGYLQGGINVSVTTGFPEIKDYSAFLDRIANPFFSSWIGDYVPNSKGVSMGVMWTSPHNLDRRYRDYDDIAPTGNFFSDVINILNAENLQLASINKSLMLLVGTNSYDNVNLDDEVQSLETAASDLEKDKNDALSSFSQFESTLVFQDVSKQLDYGKLNALSGKEFFPDYLSFEVPPYLQGMSSSSIEIHLAKARGFFDFLRDFMFWVYWGINIFCLLFVFRQFLRLCDKIGQVFFAMSCGNN